MLCARVTTGIGLDRAGTTVKSIGYAYCVPTAAEMINELSAALGDCRERTEVDGTADRGPKRTGSLPEG